MISNARCFLLGVGNFLYKEGNCKPVAPGVHGGWSMGPVAP